MGYAITQAVDLTGVARESTPLSLDTIRAEILAKLDAAITSRGTATEANVSSRLADARLPADTKLFWEATGEGPFGIPGLGPGTSITSAAAGWTYGAWSQLTAGRAEDIYVLALNVEISIAPDAAIQIGIGAPGAEVAIVELFTGGNFEGEKILLAPIRVAANSRISARLATQSGSAQTSRVRLLVIDVADTRAI